jgi:hypothetical protein
MHLFQLISAFTFWSIGTPGSTFHPLTLDAFPSTLCSKQMASNCHVDDYNSLARYALYHGDCRHHHSDFPMPSQDQRSNSAAVNHYQPFVPAGENRGQSGETAQMRCHKSHSPGDNRNVCECETLSAPAETTQPYGSTLAIYAPPNSPNPGALRDDIPPKVAYSSRPGTEYNRRKVPRAKLVSTVQSYNFMADHAHVI